MTPPNGNGRIKTAERLARIETRLDEMQRNGEDRKKENEAIICSLHNLEVQIAGWKGKVAGLATGVSAFLAIGWSLIRDLVFRP